MNRAGECYDNAAADPVFIVKSERVDLSTALARPRTAVGCAAHRVLQRIHDVLRAKVHRQAGKMPTSSADAMDEILSNLVDGPCMIRRL